MRLLSFAPNLGVSLITGDPSQLNDATVWHNLTFVDQMASKGLSGLSPVYFMGSALAAYFKLYSDRTHADAEREFRERNFDTGLIALSWRDNPDIGPLVARGDLVVKREAGMGPGWLDDATTTCDYYLLISCRPRKYAEEERESHNISVEENLLRLENTGDLGVMDKDQLILKTDDRGGEETKCEDVEGKPLADPKITDKPSDDQSAWCTKVMNGEVQLCHRPLEDVWQDAREQYPEATQEMVFMRGVGPIAMLVLNNKTVVCPVGRAILNLQTPVEHEYLVLTF